LQLFVEHIVLFNYFLPYFFYSLAKLRGLPLVAFGNVVPITLAPGELRC
jgi:hypothetical protein